MNERKRLIVTGATKGIGRAIAETFAAQGFDLAICARTQGDLDECKAALEAKYSGIRVITSAADMRKKTDVLAFAEKIKSLWDKVDVLVNNAGVFLPGSIQEEDEGVLELQIETNLYSAYHFTRAILPLMIPHQSGTIFNMCSVASLKAYPSGGSYCISKFALLGFSKVLREEMKGKGIRVCAVMPGATWSNSWKGVDLPHERLMLAEDVAKMMLATEQISNHSVVEDIVLRPQLGDV